MDEQDEGSGGPGQFSLMVEAFIVRVQHAMERYFADVDDDRQLLEVFGVLDGQLKRIEHSGRGNSARPEAASFCVIQCLWRSRNHVGYEIDPAFRHTIENLRVALRARALDTPIDHLAELRELRGALQHGPELSSAARANGFVELAAAFLHAWLTYAAQVKPAGYL